MAKFRMIHTEFWNDPRVIEEMTPEDKYFFLYLLTNPNTTQIGIYQITKKQISFDTGYSMESVNSLLDRFSNHHKLIVYNQDTRELAIKNWGKYNLNRGGKPMMDCVKKEIQEVKDLALVSLVAESVGNKDIRQIYDDFSRGAKIYFEPSKTYKPSEIEPISTREYVLWRDMQTCFYTGLILQKEDIEVDHIIPKRDKGNDIPGNLVVSYSKFNQVKSANDLEQAIRVWNSLNDSLQVNYAEIKAKISDLIEFEKARESAGITFRESISNNVRCENTLRKFLDTYRGQYKEEEEEEEEEEEHIVEFSPDSPEYILTQLLISRMHENNPNAKTPKTDKTLESWIDAIEKLHRLDKYTHEQIREAIEWSQSNEFWKSNILSAPKLREKMATLILQMQRPQRKQGSQYQRTVDELDRLYWEAAGNEQTRNH